MVDVLMLLQRHEVQPDVYCRRLLLQVPVSVSVKTGQIADVFHAICGIAMNPWVLSLHECIVYVTDDYRLVDIRRFLVVPSAPCHQPRV